MGNTNANTEYYASRAREYDASSSYQRPESRAALAPLRAQYQLAFAGADVLEIACGTGYWTRTVAQTAKSVTATDINEPVIDEARRRAAHLSNVRFLIADAYALSEAGGRFTGAFAQFWWSHIPQMRVRDFLKSLHGRLAPGARVMFLDTLYTRSSAQQGVDSEGDLMIQRALRDGTRYEIVKNIPTEEQLRTVLAGFAEDLVFKEYELPGWWLISYRARMNA